MKPVFLSKNHEFTTAVLNDLQFSPIFTFWNFYLTLYLEPFGVWNFQHFNDHLHQINIYMLMEIKLFQFDGSRFSRLPSCRKASNFRYLILLIKFHQNGMNRFVFKIRPSSYIYFTICHMPLKTRRYIHGEFFLFTFSILWMNHKYINFFLCNWGLNKLAFGFISMWCVYDFLNKMIIKPTITYTLREQNQYSFRKCRKTKLKIKLISVHCLSTCKIRILNN